MIDPKTEISESDYMQIERLEEKPLRTVGERLQRIEDLREINDLIWRYAHLSDRAGPGFKERLVNEFCTEDVIKIHGGTLKQRFVGRQACLDGWKAATLVTIEGEKSKARRPSSNDPATGLPLRGWAALHWNMPMIVRIADDSKHAWVAYYHFINHPRIENDELTLRGHSGTDSFWLVKQDRWRIAKWVVQTDIGFRGDVFDKPVRKLSK